MGLMADTSVERPLPPIEANNEKGDRFFSATAMAGRLHVNDIGEYASWDPARIAYIVEHDLDAILPRMVVAKVRTVAELDDLIVRSQGRPGSISMFVHEDLLGAARERWERMRTEQAAKPGRDE